MPCNWLTHNNSQLFIDVGIADASKGGGIFSNPQTFRALIDTGAQKTMISNRVVTSLNLKVVGKIPIQGVGPKPSFHNGCLFHVVFAVPMGRPPGQQAAPGTPIPMLAFTLPAPIYGAEIGPVRGFDVLLGMDVICTGSLKVEGNGTASFSI